jgi:hypothetical protein
MGIRLVGFPVAGGGGREVYVNPEQVVCLLDIGGDRAQIVTTGLSGQTSMSLIVERPVEAVFRALMGAQREGVHLRGRSVASRPMAPGGVVAA